MFKKFNALSKEEQYKYKVRLKNLYDELWLAFKKITDGRIASMGLHKSLKNPDNIEDISINAIISIFRYINRYDANRKTSAFAYVTQLAYTNIVASLSEINEHEYEYVTGLDFLDNINTIDDPLAAFSATNKFIKALED